MSLIPEGNLMNSIASVTQRSRILICSHDARTLDFMDGAISTQPQYEATRLGLDYLPQSFDKIDLDQFDLVVIDVGDGEVLRKPELAKIRAEIGDTPVLFVSEHLEDDLMRLLVLLNGKDWLRKPLERRTFLDAINTHMNTVKAGSGLVHAVVSAAAGAGGTSVALTLAHHLAKTRKRLKPHVALFDLDFSAADCGAYLNLINPYDLQNAMENPGRIDAEFIDIVRKQHEAGFSLFSFLKPELLLSPAASELVLRMLDVIAFQNDHTVIDLPYYETSWREQVLASVNSVVVVTSVSIPALQSAKLLKNRVAQIRGESRTVQILANKSHGGGLFGAGLSASEIRKIFKDDNIVIIPDEREIMLRAVNHGILPNEVNSRSKFDKFIGRLADGLREVN